MTKTLPHYYFAYGSNMNYEKISRRCRQPIFQGQALLRGYKFIINAQGASTIIPDIDSEVYGILWQIRNIDEKRLDKYEAIDQGIYKKIFVNVESKNIKLANAFTYIHSNNIPGSGLSEYVEDIVLIAMKHKLPDKYIFELQHWLKNTQGQHGCVFETMINDTTNSYSSFINLLNKYNGIILHSNHIEGADTPTGKIRIIFSFDINNKKVINNIQSFFSEEGFILKRQTE